MYRIQASATWISGSSGCSAIACSAAALARSIQAGLRWESVVLRAGVGDGGVGEREAGSSATALSNICSANSTSCRVRRRA